MTGYSSVFISAINLALPKINPVQKKYLAPLIASPNEFELKYTHFSVMVHKQRRFAFFAATNIDGKTWNAAVKDRVAFKKDPQMLEQFQVGDELYDFYKSKTNNDFDKGSLPCSVKTYDGKTVCMINSERKIFYH